MDQKDRIVSYLVKSSPFGQQKVVVEMVKKLVEYDFQPLLNKYYQEHLVQNQEDQPADNQSLQQFRLALKTQAEEYVNKYFKQEIIGIIGNSGSLVKAQEGDFNFTICFTSKNVNLANLYSGQWISRYKINQQNIQGNISINCHYFQNGNVQLKNQKKIEKNWEYTGNAKEDANRIFMIIQTAENDLQQALNQMYETMEEKFFKPLRRLQNLKKSRMQWNINAYNMRHNLKK